MAQWPQVRRRVEAAGFGTPWGDDRLGYHSPSETIRRVWRTIHTGVSGVESSRRAHLGTERMSLLLRPHVGRVDREFKKRDVVGSRDSEDDRLGNLARIESPAVPVLPVTHLRDDWPRHQRRNPDIRVG